MSKPIKYGNITFHGLTESQASSFMNEAFGKSDGKLSPGGNRADRRGKGRRKQKHKPSSQPSADFSGVADVVLSDELLKIIECYGATVRTSPQLVEHAGVVVPPNIYALYEAAVFANYVNAFLANDPSKPTSIAGGVAIMHHFYTLIHDDVELPYVTEEMVEQRDRYGNAAADHYAKCRDALIKCNVSIYSAILD